jgi:photosystem II stability/assembly factor-like uncharacterized protein
MRSLKQIPLLLLLISLLSTGNAIGQDADYTRERKPHTEKGKNKQLLRQQKLFHKYSDLITNPENQRWLEYRKANSHLLSQKHTVAAADWKSCGPVNQAGRMISHAFDPSNTNTLWVGAATGGLWRTTDAGNSWEPMTDQLPSLTVGAIGINPKDPNTMLMGTGEGYMLSAWFQYGVGVLKSTDGGITWDQTSLAYNDSLRFASLGMVWDPVNTNNVCLATTYGIFTSTDMGDTWALTLPGVVTSIIINPKQPAAIYAALQEYGSSIGGVYMSIDHGQTWTRLFNGLCSSARTGFTCLSICDSFPNVVYAGIAKPAADPDCGELEGLYRSSDGGTHWTLLPHIVDFYCYPAPYEYVCQGWYGNVVRSSPIDSNKIYAGGIYLYRSSNGGNSWNYSDDVPSGVDRPYMHPDHHSLAVDPSDPNVMYSLNDGGIYKSVDAGLTWVEKNNGLVTTQFYYITDSRVNSRFSMGGTQDNGVWYTYNSGSQDAWKQFVAGDGFFCQTDRYDDKTFYATELFAGRSRTRDGGATSDSINNGINEGIIFTMPLVLNPLTSNKMLTASDAKIYRSDDYGDTWTPVFNASHIIMIEYDKVNPEVMYIGSDSYYDNSYLFRSDNGGNSWQPITAPCNKIVDIETDPLVSGVLYATRSGYSVGKQIWRSADFGNTWVCISDSLPALPVNCIAISAHNNQHLYAGTDLGVFLSTDGGTTWQSFNDNLPRVIVMDILYHDSDTTVRVGTHGRGMWISKAASPAAIDTIPSGDFCVGNVDIFPNPMTSSGTIRYTMGKDCNVSIKVYNALGQQVNDLYNGSQTAGEQIIAWKGVNSNGLPIAAGIYYIRFISGRSAVSYKVVVH